VQWEGRRGSGNVIVRRGVGGPAVGGGLGILVLLAAMFFGVDPGALLGGGGGGDVSAPMSAEEQRLVEFVKVVLADTEDVWNEQFAKSGRRYEEPKLIVFSGRVESACGFASAAVGPFYCPQDRTVYVDLSFFAELDRRFGAPGDFAQAYVIAHEIGHHVQTLLGTTERAQSRQRSGDRRAANEVSVRVELQADFLAGVWAHHAQRTKKILEPGDVEEALRAAAAVGDDRLQEQSRGRVVPDAFTHGTSAQRAAWFRRGFETGDVSQGDTFDDALYRSVGTR
jgi:predicted metalloprotease